MGIEHTESFQGWNGASWAGKFYAEAGLNTPSAGGPNGTYFYTGAGGFTITRILSGNLPRVIMGGRYKWVVNSGTILQFLETSTTQIRVAVDGLGRVSVVNGAGTTLATSAVNVWPVGTWHYIELDATLHGTAGSFTVALDGVTILSGAGVKTTGNANNYANKAGWANGGGNATITDWYILNATGAPNTLLGDVSIFPLRATGAGFYTAFTLGAGASKPAAIAEQTTDGDTSYNVDGTPGDRDSFAVTDLGATLVGSIAGLVVKTYARKDDAGARTLSTLVRLAGVDAIPAAHSLGTAYAWQEDAFALDPSGAAWTPANVNAAEFGYELTS